MLQNQFANYADKLFDKDTASIVRSHALWASIIMALPLFGFDLFFYCFILWDMYSDLCKRAHKKLDFGNIIVGFIVNIVVAFILDTALTFIPVIGWLGTAFIVYLQFYFSGKSFIESIKSGKLPPASYPTALMRPESAVAKKSELPAFHVQSRKQDENGGFWNGFFGGTEDNILDEFYYAKGRVVFIMMNSRQISGSLSGMKVRFWKQSMMIYMQVLIDRDKVTIARVDNFTDSQWDAIIGTLFLAEDIEGRDTFGTTYKYVSRADLIQKIITKLK